MLLAIHGAPLSVRHEALVQSALAAPRRLFERDPAAGLATLAAAYAAGLAQNHGFIEGSKRAAFTAAYIFLGLNGYDLDATEPEVVSVIESVAAREMSEAAVTEWLRGVITRTA